jgi:putative transposase
MTIRRGYKLRLYPTGAQRRVLEHWCGGARWTWNAALDWRETLYRRGHAKNISGQYWLAKLVTRWKRAGSHPWLEDVPADVLGNKLEDQDKAYKAFFEGRGRYPQFKSKRERQSVRVNLDARHHGKQRAWAEGTILAPLVGSLRTRGRALPATMAKALTFSREPDGRWFVSFSTDESAPQAGKAKHRCAGVDLGVKTLATVATDTGVYTIDNDRHERRFAPAKAKLRQRLARQVKGSGRRERTKRRLARLCRREADCRSNATHHATIRIARESQAVAIEDLNVKGMTTSAKGTAAAPGKNIRQKAGLNRAVLDAGFAEWRRQLGYKTRWLARELVTVERFAPTSKECNACGDVNKALKLSEREWTCAGCAAKHNRDENAAKNIRRRGLEKLKSPGGTGKVHVQRRDDNNPGLREGENARRHDDGGTCPHSEATGEQTCRNIPRPRSTTAQNRGNPSHQRDQPKQGETRPEGSGIC